jgi:hypothetical protein
MTDAGTDTGSREPDDPASTPAARERERHRRLAAVFGEPLPATTRDEREGWGERARGEGRDEEWWRGQVPPHHG